MKFFIYEIRLISYIFLVAGMNGGNIRVQLAASGSGSESDCSQPEPTAASANNTGGVWSDSAKMFPLQSQTGV